MKIPETLIKTVIAVRNDVGILTDPGKFEAFQELYLAVREKENRLFSDEQVELLPYLNPADSHYREWLLRADTLKRFEKYLQYHQPEGPVLDIGCGNGWFTRHLESITGQIVIGLDVNLPELEQAARVFKMKGLFFVFGDVFGDVFYPGRFKLIVLNSSVQYFQDLQGLLQRLSVLLHDEGEIHVLDSPVFQDEFKALKAKERSIAYYKKLGFPELAGSYHHHHLNELKNSDHLAAGLLFNPDSTGNKLRKLFRKNSSPFPWIRMTKK
jgi:SAM-dependent methyltransferase